MELDSLRGAPTAMRSLLRLLGLRLALAWITLQLLAYQMALVDTHRLFEEPLEAALARAGIAARATEVALVWSDPLTAFLPPEQDQGDGFARMEAAAGSWLSAFGSRLGVEEWRVIERRSRAPQILAFAGRGRGQQQVEVWLHGPDQGPSGLPVWPGAGLVVRFRVADNRDWSTALLEEWLPALPDPWRRTAPPKIVTRWELSGKAGAPLHREGVEEAVARSLAARVVGEGRDGDRRLMWLASPRAGRWAPWARLDHRAAEANMRLLWYDRGQAGGKAGGSGPVAEFVASPHPLSAVARGLERAWLTGQAAAARGVRAAVSGV